MSDPSTDPTGNLYKTEGNDFLNENKVQKAIESYTKAIECDPKNHIFYSNRSAAYTKAFEYEKAVEDASQAILLEPTFVKAYTRKAQALLTLKRFEECYETCLIGLKYESNNRTLSETMKSCKKNYIVSQLSGRWLGKVEFGNYDQLMDFEDDENLVIYAMGQTVNARYSVNAEKTPMWLDVSMPAPPEQVAMYGPIPDQEIPHIFRFDVDVWTPFQQRIETRVLGPKKSASKKSISKGDLPSAAVSSTDIDVDAAMPTISTLELCAPMDAPVRPTKFNSKTGCVFRRVDEEADKERVQLVTNERVVPEEIAAMDFEAQVEHFIATMTEIIPNEPMVQPSPEDTPAEQEAKMQAIMDFQQKLTRFDAMYPQEVSTAVQEYTYSPAETVPERFREAMTVLRNKLEHHQGGGQPEQRQQMQETIMAAMQEAKVLVDQAKAQGKELNEQEIQELIKFKLAERSAGGSLTPPPAEASQEKILPSRADSKQATVAQLNKKKKAPKKASTESAAIDEQNKDEETSNGSSGLFIGLAVGAAALAAAAFFVLRKKN